MLQKLKSRNSVHSDWNRPPWAFGQGSAFATPDPGKPSANGGGTSLKHEQNHELALSFIPGTVGRLLAVPLRFLPYPAAEREHSAGKPPSQTAPKQTVLA